MQRSVNKQMATQKVAIFIYKKTAINFYSSCTTIFN